MLRTKPVTPLAIVIVSASILLGCNSGEKTVVSAACNVDSVDGVGGERFAVKAKKLVVNGWAADSATKSSPKALTLHLEDKSGTTVLAVTNVKRLERSDVAAYFKEDGYRNSGFEAVVDASQIQRGDYVVKLSMKRDGTTVVCKAPKVLTIQ